MDAYDGRLTLGDARAAYFVHNHFGPDGGYGDAWVRVTLGPVAMAFPNTAGRVRAVRYHDLHHVVTGYPTTVVGEGQIGAWELATGCAHHSAAWVLNTVAMVGATFWSPRVVFAAFVRGRHCRNLYRWAYTPEMLTRTVADTQTALGLDQAPTPPTWADRALFGTWFVAGALTCGVGFVLTAVPLGAVLAVGSWWTRSRPAHP